MTRNYHSIVIIIQRLQLIDRHNNRINCPKFLELFLRIHIPSHYNHTSEQVLLKINEKRNKKNDGDRDTVKTSLIFIIHPLYFYDNILEPFSRTLTRTYAFSPSKQRTHTRRSEKKSPMKIRSDYPTGNTVA